MRNNPPMSAVFPNRLATAVVGVVDSLAVVVSAVVVASVLSETVVG